MKTSQQWFDYFKLNLQKERIDWNLTPQLSKEELQTIVKSMQAWQLGETSEGKTLIQVSTDYAKTIHDENYVKAVELFIKEEQKHGENLGKYLDCIGKPRIKKNWGDSLFRKTRYFTNSMELWTLTVITVESAAQIYYQCLKDATDCPLLKQICTDILIDEAAHITFQTERMSVIFNAKGSIRKNMAFYAYKYFYFCTAFVVWLAHKKVFEAGGNSLAAYHKKMSLKFNKTLQKLKLIEPPYNSLQSI